MERNTITEIKNLQIGDRFYKKGDKNKEVYTKVEPGDDVQTNLKKVKHFGKKDKEKWPEYLTENIQVVFLRHQNT